MEYEVKSDCGLSGYRRVRSRRFRSGVRNSQEHSSRCSAATSDFHGEHKSVRSQFRSLIDVARQILDYVGVSLRQCTERIRGRLSFSSAKIGFDPARGFDWVAGFIRRF